MAMFGAKEARGEATLPDLAARLRFGVPTGGFETRFYPVSHVCGVFHGW